MEIKELFKTMEYGPAPEQSQFAQDWLDKWQSKLKLYINGEWREAKSGEYVNALNPSTGKVLTQVSKAAKEDLEDAVQSAKNAQKAWYELGGHVRARYLYAIAREIQKSARLLAVLETMNNGKPIRETRDIDVPLVARHFYYHAGCAQLMDIEMADYEPVGVVGQIIPWNFPLLMMAWKIAPALSMGNTVVLKPASYTPVTAVLFAEICHNIGLPPGVVNIVTGPSIIGQELVRHPDVKKIAFTGSTSVGKWIRKESAGSGKKLSLELGGKSPFIVFEDADLDSAIEGVVDAIWFNQGEVCCAGSRLLVQESIAEKFIAKLRNRMEKLRVGDPLDKAVDMGAIVSPQQLETISDLVKVGIKEGGRVIQPSWQLPTQGFFYHPTLITDLEPASTIVQEEIFGPVLVSLTFRTPKEAVELANNTVYGLAASIWTEDINLALDIAPKVKAGSVWINCTNLFDAGSGFGGYKESGYGREGGKEGLFEYVVHKEEMKGFENEFTKLSVPEQTASKDTLHSIPSINRTPKLYVGGKQVRPDATYSIQVVNPSGQTIGEVGRGNRKDIRNAVHVGRSSLAKWGSYSGHNRAQILYYIAENLNQRRDEYVRRLEQVCGYSKEMGELEFDTTIKVIFMYAAFADKYDGLVHSTLTRHVTLAMNEPIGNFALLCPDEHPLLSFISIIIPPISMGNVVTVIPSEKYPLLATDFYQILETSDLPAGVVNIVTGYHNELLPFISSHHDIDAIWYFGSQENSFLVEESSATNMKRTWVSNGKKINWFNLTRAREFLRESTQVKNIWIPYGV